MSLPFRHQSDLVASAKSAQARIADSMQTIDGYSYSCRGNDGPWVVFVPTFAELNFVYAPLVDQLERTNRTLLFNPHVSTTETFGPAARARELGIVLDTLGIRDQIHIVSWSDAGMGAHMFGEVWLDRILSCTYIGMPNRYVLPPGLRRLSQLVREQLAPPRDARSGISLFDRLSDGQCDGADPRSLRRDSSTRTGVGLPEIQRAAVLTA